MARFHRMLAEDAERAQYGWRHVRAAVSAGAVDRLFVSDSLLRAPDPRVRRDVQRLLSDARAAGATAATLSSLHVSGEALQGLGGIAAVLHYAVYGLDDAARAVPRAGEGAEPVDEAGAPALPGHHVQAAAPVVRARALDFGSGGFDTASDCSDDSDEAAGS